MQNYNFIQKLLHDLVLSNKLVNKSLFELEKFLYLKNNNIDKNSHVFITSLPRSGTTILLNFLNFYWITKPTDSCRVLFIIMCFYK